NASKAALEQDALPTIEVHPGKRERAGDFFEGERRVERYRSSVASVCEVPRLVRLLRHPVETCFRQRSRDTSPSVVGMHDQSHQVVARWRDVGWRIGLWLESHGTAVADHLTSAFGNDKEA